MPTVDELKAQIHELGKEHGALHGQIIRLQKQVRDGSAGPEALKDIEKLETKRHNLELEIRRHCADLNSVSMQGGS